MNNETNVDELIKRLSLVEDQLAILNMLAGSAHSSDIASEAYWDEMFAENAVMDRGQDRPNDLGKENILAIVRGPEQRVAIEAGMAHLAMLPRIDIQGNSAVATGYLLVTVPDEGASRVELAGKGRSPGISIYQLTVNRWELVRVESGWQVKRRVVRPISADDARQILGSGISRNPVATSI